MKVILVMLIAVFICGSGLTAELSNTAPMKNMKAITGQEQLPEGHAIPYQPGATLDSPGIIVGTTYYDYQTNGSTGNRIAICDDGSKYFDWMNLLGWPYPPAPRHVYHNWMDVNGVLNPNQFDGQVNRDAGAGYTTMDVYDGNRGAIAYHSTGGNPPTNVTFSIDNEIPGMGFFYHYNPPDELFPQTPDSPGLCLWPYTCVDRNNNIHIVMTEATDRRLSRMGYCNSTDGGPTWSTLYFVDTVMVISSVIDASPVSDRVALAYSRCLDTTTQFHNNIYYVVSDDGTSWDFRYGRINITNYPDPDDWTDMAYTDVDIIFDYNDNIHVVWTAQPCSANYYRFTTSLLHWDEESGEIEEVFHHPESLWIPDIEGAWNNPISKMNLGVNTDNDLFCTYTFFDTTDISAGNFANGEIYASFKPYGANWAPPINLTHSPSPGCFPGECDSDHWSSLADVVDDAMHVIYINDKDAGGIPQTEGSPTESPVMYLEVPLPFAKIFGNVVDDNLQPLEDAMIKISTYWQSEEVTVVNTKTDANGDYTIYVYEGTFNIEASKPGYRTQTETGVELDTGEVYPQDFTLERVGIDENDNMPFRFSLSQNYPNPFNAQTMINYSLSKASQVRLDIYDILGRHIETLVDETRPAGRYEAIWDAADAASGMYFYKLSAGDKTETKQMVLLK